jgi:hypothetical protein
VTAAPSGGPTPGARALRDAVHQQYFPNTFGDLGIYNPRDVCGNPWPLWKCAPSQHAYGKAVDFGVRPIGGPAGDRLAQWLIDLAPLGVAEVIWNRRRWTPSTGWRPYTGRSDHRDHVHVALTDRAAQTLTADSIRLWFQQEEDVTPEQDQRIKDIRAEQDRLANAIQKLWDAEIKRDAVTDARLDRIEQAVGQPLPTDAAGFVDQIADRLANILASRLKD